ncbi:MAG: hypothetical protein HYT97_08685 [Elusimicrobia bacterium]|nr:hypothetical protein [Elusimicrobiota bacterium]
MIKFWNKKSNKSWKQLTASLVVFCFLFSTLSAPFAQASFWSERRKAVEEYKKSNSQNLGFQVASAAGFSGAETGALGLNSISNKLEMSGIESKLSSQVMNRVMDKVKSRGSSRIAKRDRVSLGLPSELVNRIETYGEIEQVYLSKGMNLKMEVHKLALFGQALSPASNSSISSNPFVILIQEAHDIYGVQANIAYLLMDAIKMGVEIVGVEGSRGIMQGIEKWRNHPDKESVMGVAGYLLKEGLLSGVEIAGLSTQGGDKAIFGREKGYAQGLSTHSGERSVQFYGVEDKEPYLEQVKSFKDTLTFSQEVKDWQLGLEKKLAELKEETYTPELKDLDQWKNDYEAGNKKLAEWVEFLQVTHSLLNNHYPNVAKYLKAYKLEKQIDFKKIEADQKKILQALAEKLNRGELTELLEDSLLYRLGKMGYGEFYESIREKCKNAKIKITPDMERYIQYLVGVEGIERVKLFQEVKELENEVWTMVAGTPSGSHNNQATAQVVQADKDYRLIKKGLDFKLNVEEWKEYVSRADEIESGISALSLSPFTGAVKQALENVKRFNQLSEERNEIFLKNLLGAMNPKDSLRTPAQIVALVAGGYHASGIEERLKKKNISFITIRPKMQSSEIKKEYHPLNSFKRDLLPLEKMFMHEKVTLAPQRAMGTVVMDGAVISEIGVEGALRTVVPVLGFAHGRADVENQIENERKEENSAIGEVSLEDGSKFEVKVFGAEAQVQEAEAKGGAIEIETDYSFVENQGKPEKLKPEHVVVKGVGGKFGRIKKTVLAAGTFAAALVAGIIMLPSPGDTKELVKEMAKATVENAQKHPEPNWWLVLLVAGAVIAAIVYLIRSFRGDIPGSETYVLHGYEARDLIKSGKKSYDQGDYDQANKIFNAAEQSLERAIDLDSRGIYGRSKGYDELAGVYRGTGQEDRANLIAGYRSDAYKYHHPSLQFESAKPKSRGRLSRMFMLALTLPLGIGLSIAGTGSLEAITEYSLAEQEYFRADPRRITQGKKTIELEGAQVRVLRELKDFEDYLDKMGVSPELREQVLERWDQHYAVFEIKNEKLGYTAYASMHRLTKIVSFADSIDGTFRAMGGVRVKIDELDETNIKRGVYLSDADALGDALELSSEMSFKTAMANLKVGGAKTAIRMKKSVADNQETRKAALYNFAAVTEALVPYLNGGFLTGKDEGVTDSDILEMHKFAPTSIIPHVSAHLAEGKGKEPSRPTAIGVLSAMKTLAEHQYGSSSLVGKVVAVQGLGDVGGSLVDFLMKEGAIVVFADLEKEKLDKFLSRYPHYKGLLGDRLFPLIGKDADYLFNPLEQGSPIKDQLEARGIHKINIFSPSAARWQVNENTIPRIAAAGVDIIVGSANNMVKDRKKDSETLMKLNITLFPDYGGNPGGAIVANGHLKGNNISNEAIYGLVKDNTNKIIEEAKLRGVTLLVVADELARKKFNELQKNAGAPLPIGRETSDLDKDMEHEEFIIPHEFTVALGPLPDRDFNSFVMMVRDQASSKIRAILEGNDVEDGEKEEKIIKHLTKLFASTGKIKSIQVLNEDRKEILGHYEFSYLSDGGYYRVELLQEKFDLVNKSNLAVGTFIAIYDLENNLVGSIAFINGPITTMLVTNGKDQIKHFAYNGQEFVLREDKLDLSKATNKDKSPAALGGNLIKWPAPFQQYYLSHERAIPGSDGASSPLKTRYGGVREENTNRQISALGANLYEILINNGFMAEGLSPSVSRLIASFVKAAGGDAAALTSKGFQKIEDVPMDEPVVHLYAGNMGVVQKIAEDPKFKEPADLNLLRESRAPPEEVIDMFSPIEIEDSIEEDTLESTLLKLLPSTEENQDIINAMLAVEQVAALVPGLYVTGGKATGEVDSGGADQREIDNITDGLFASAVKPYVWAYHSEEGMINYEDGEGKIFAFIGDPLDGSTKVKSNGGGGTIGAFLHLPNSPDSDGKRKEGLIENASGRDIVASFFVTYGVETKLVFAYKGLGAREFVLRGGKFQYVGQVKFDSAEDQNKPIRVALGGSRSKWPQGFPALNDQWESQGWVQGYAGAMVTDMYGAIQHILGGGRAVFAYLENKLRVRYEIAPMAFIMEEAGGASLTHDWGEGDKNPQAVNVRSVLDIKFRFEKDQKAQQKAPVALGDRATIAQIRRAIERDLSEILSSKGWPEDIAAAYASEDYLKIESIAMDESREYGEAHRKKADQSVEALVELMKSGNTSMEPVFYLQVSRAIYRIATKTTLVGTQTMTDLHGIYANLRTSGKLPGDVLFFIARNFNLIVSVRGIRGITFSSLTGPLDPVEAERRLANLLKQSNTGRIVAGDNGEGGFTFSEFIPALTVFFAAVVFAPLMWRFALTHAFNKNFRGAVNQLFSLRTWQMAVRLGAFGAMGAVGESGSSDSGAKRSIAQILGWSAEERGNFLNLLFSIYLVQRLLNWSDKWYEAPLMRDSTEVEESARVVADAKRAGMAGIYYSRDLRKIYDKSLEGGRIISAFAIALNGMAAGVEGFAVDDARKPIGLAIEEKDFRSLGKMVRLINREGLVGFSDSEIETWRNLLFQNGITPQEEAPIEHKTIDYYDEAFLGRIDSVRKVKEFNAEQFKDLIDQLIKQSKEGTWSPDRDIIWEAQILMLAAIRARKEGIADEDYKRWYLKIVGTQYLYHMYKSFFVQPAVNAILEEAVDNGMSWVDGEVVDSLIDFWILETADDPWYGLASFDEFIEYPEIARRMGTADPLKMKRILLGLNQFALIPQARASFAVSVFGNQRAQLARPETDALLSRAIELVFSHRKNLLDFYTLFVQENSSEEIIRFLSNLEELESQRSVGTAGSDEGTGSTAEKKYGSSGPSVPGNGFTLAESVTVSALFITAVVFAPLIWRFALTQISFVAGVAQFVALHAAPIALIVGGVSVALLYAFNKNFRGAVNQLFSPRTWQMAVRLVAFGAMGAVGREGTGTLSEDVKEDSAGKTEVVETGVRVEVRVETQDKGQTIVADKVVKTTAANKHFLGISQFPDGVYDAEFPITSFLIGAGALASSFMHALQTALKLIVLGSLGALGGGAGGMPADEAGLPVGDTGEPTDKGGSQEKPWKKITSFEDAVKACDIFYSVVKRRKGLSSTLLETQNALAILRNLTYTYRPSHPAYEFRLSYRIEENFILLIDANELSGEKRFNITYENGFGVYLIDDQTVILETPQGTVMIQRQSEEGGDKFRVELILTAEGQPVNAVPTDSQIAEAETFAKEANITSDEDFKNLVAMGVPSAMEIYIERVIRSMGMRVTDREAFHLFVESYEDTVARFVSLHTKNPDMISHTVLKQEERSLFMLMLMLDSGRGKWLAVPSRDPAEMESSEIMDDEIASIVWPFRIGRVPSTAAWEVLSDAFWVYEGKYFDQAVSSFMEWWENVELELFPSGSSMDSFMKWKKDKDNTGKSLIELYAEWCFEIDQEYRKNPEYNKLGFVTSLFNDGRSLYWPVHEALFATLERKSTEGDERAGEILSEIVDLENATFRIFKVQVKGGGEVSAERMINIMGRGKSSKPRATPEGGFTFSEFIPALTVFFAAVVFAPLMWRFALTHGVAQFVSLNAAPITLTVGGAALVLVALFAVKHHSNLGTALARFTAPDTAFGKIIRVPLFGALMMAGGGMGVLDAGSQKTDVASLFHNSVQLPDQYKGDADLYDSLLNYWERQIKGESSDTARILALGHFISKTGRRYNRTQSSIDYQLSQMTYRELAQIANADYKLREKLREEHLSSHLSAEDLALITEKEKSIQSMAAQTLLQPYEKVGVHQSLIPDFFKPVAIDAYLLVDSVKLTVEFRLVLLRKVVQEAKNLFRGLRRKGSEWVDSLGQRYTQNQMTQLGNFRFTGYWFDWVSLAMAGHMSGFSKGLDLGINAPAIKDWSEEDQSHFANLVHYILIVQDELKRSGIKEGDDGKLSFNIEWVRGYLEIMIDVKRNGMVGVKLPNIKRLFDAALSKSHDVHVNNFGKIAESAQRAGVDGFDEEYLSSVESNVASRTRWLPTDLKYVEYEKFVTNSSPQEVENRIMEALQKTPRSLDAAEYREALDLMEIAVQQRKEISDEGYLSLYQEFLKTESWSNKGHSRFGSDFIVLILGEAISSGRKWMSVEMVKRWAFDRGAFTNTAWTDSLLVPAVQHGIVSDPKIIREWISRLTSLGYPTSAAKIAAAAYSNERKLIKRDDVEETLEKAVGSLPADGKADLLRIFNTNEAPTITAEGKSQGSSGAQIVTGIVALVGLTAVLSAGLILSSQLPGGAEVLHSVASVAGAKASAAGAMGNLHFDSSLMKSIGYGAVLGSLSSFWGGKFWSKAPSEVQLDVRQADEVTAMSQEESWGRHPTHVWYDEIYKGIGLTSILLTVGGVLSISAILWGFSFGDVANAMGLGGALPVAQAASWGSGAVLAAASGLINFREQAQKLVIREDIWRKYPEIFGNRIVNGRPVGVEDLIRKFTLQFGPEFSDRLKDRRDFLKAVANGTAKYGFQPLDEVFEDPDGEELTVEEIRERLKNNFYGAEGKEGWRLNDKTPVPQEVLRPGLQGTGPAHALRMMMSAINAKTSSWMFDWEDAGDDYDDKLYRAWKNLKEVLAGKWENREYTEGGKTSSIKLPRGEWGSIFHRLPGLGIRNRQMWIGGERVPATIAAMVIHVLNNYESLKKNGSGIYFYIPKIETPQEALLIGKLLKALEEEIGVPRGTIKIEMLHERIRFTQNQEIIMWVLRDWLIGPNVGRWDFIASRVEMGKDDPKMVLPNPHDMKMTEASMTEYTRRNAILTVLAAVKNGKMVNGMPIGGMSAVMERNVPEEGEPREKMLAANEKAVRDIWFDKLRERLTGLIEINGIQYDTYRQSWVATITEKYVRSGEEPLIASLDELQGLVDRSDESELKRLKDLGLVNELGRIQYYVVTKEDIDNLWSPQKWDDLTRVPKGDISIDGIEYAATMSAEYGFGVLNGNQAVKIFDYKSDNGMMNDFATHEIFWHWMWTLAKHEVVLTKDGTMRDGTVIKAGTKVTPELLKMVLDKVYVSAEKKIDYLESQGLSKNDRRFSPLIMKILERQLIIDNGDHTYSMQNKWVTYGSRILLSIIELDPEKDAKLIDQILDAVYSDSRKDVAEKVRSGEWDKKTLEAYDYVFDNPDAREFGSVQGIARRVYSHFVGGAKIAGMTSWIMKMRQNISTLDQWMKSDRFIRIHRTRPYSAREIYAIRGAVLDDTTFHDLMTRKLFFLMGEAQRTGIPIVTGGVMDGPSAAAMAQKGMKALYFSGWQMSHHWGEPDLAKYPDDTVPNKIYEINHYLRNQHEDQIGRYKEMSDKLEDIFKEFYRTLPRTKADDLVLRTEVRDEFIEKFMNAVKDDLPIFVDELREDSETVLYNLFSEIVVQAIAQYVSQGRIAHEQRNALRETVFQTLEGYLIDYLIPFYADGDTGHLSPEKLVQYFVRAGAASIHLEDQADGEKKCGHMAGKVLTSMKKHFQRLLITSKERDRLHSELLIIARTDAQAAKLLQSNDDPMDHYFILGSSVKNLPSLKDVIRLARGDMPEYAYRGDNEALIDRAKDLMARVNHQELENILLPKTPAQVLEMWEQEFPELAKTIRDIWKSTGRIDGKRLETDVYFLKVKDPRSTEDGNLLTYNTVWVHRELIEHGEYPYLELDTLMEDENGKEVTVKELLEREPVHLAKEEAALQKLTEIWRAEAKLKTYSQAVGEKILEMRTSRFISEQGRENIKKWWEDATNPLTNTLSLNQMKSLAKTIGIEIDWDWDKPRVYEGFYQIDSGLGVLNASIRMRQYAKIADVAWMEQDRPNIKHAREFHDNVVNDPHNPESKSIIFALNLSPSFNWSDPEGWSAVLTKEQIENIKKAKLLKGFKWNNPNSWGEYGDDVLVMLEAIANFSIDMGRAGFGFQFVTIFQDHTSTLHISRTAKEMLRLGAAGFVFNVQQMEQLDGVIFEKHQTAAGVKRVSKGERVIMRGSNATGAAGKDSTENQFGAGDDSNKVKRGLISMDDASLKEFAENSLMVASWLGTVGLPAAIAFGIIANAVDAYSGGAFSGWNILELSLGLGSLFGGIWAAKHFKPINLIKNYLSPQKGWEGGALGDIFEKKELSPKDIENLIKYTSFISQETHEVEIPNRGWVKFQLVRVTNPDLVDENAVMNSGDEEQINKLLAGRLFKENGVMGSYNLAGLPLENGLSLGLNYIYIQDGLTPEQEYFRMDHEQRQLFWYDTLYWKLGYKATKEWTAQRAAHIMAWGDQIIANNYKSFKEVPFLNERIDQIISNRSSDLVSWNLLKQIAFARREVQHSIQEEYSRDYPDYHRGLNAILAFEESLRVPALAEIGKADFSLRIFNPIDLDKVIKASGLPGDIKNILEANNGKVLTAYQFLDQKDSFKGGFSLSPRPQLIGTADSPRGALDDVFEVFSDVAGLVVTHVPFTYLMNSGFERLLNQLTSQGKPIVIFAPSVLERSQDMDYFYQWLLDKHVRLSNLTFVFGAYDVVSQNDYKNSQVFKYATTSDHRRIIFEQALLSYKSFVKDTSIIVLATAVIGLLAVGTVGMLELILPGTSHAMSALPALPSLPAHGFDLPKDLSWLNSSTLLVGGSVAYLAKTVLFKGKDSSEVERSVRMARHLNQKEFLARAATLIKVHPKTLNSLVNQIQNASESEKIEKIEQALYALGYEYKLSGDRAALKQGTDAILRTVYKEFSVEVPVIKELTSTFDERAAVSAEDAQGVQKLAEIAQLFDPQNYKKRALSFEQAEEFSQIVTEGYRKAFLDKGIASIKNVKLSGLSKESEMFELSALFLSDPESASGAKHLITRLHERAKNGIGEGERILLSRLGAEDSFRIELKNKLIEKMGVQDGEALYRILDEGYRAGRVKFQGETRESAKVNVPKIYKDLGWWLGPNFRIITDDASRLALGDLNETKTIVQIIELVSGIEGRDVTRLVIGIEKKFRGKRVVDIQA